MDPGEETVSWPRRTRNRLIPPAHRSQRWGFRNTDKRGFNGRTSCIWGFNGRMSHFARGKARRTWRERQSWQPKIYDETLVFRCAFMVSLLFLFQGIELGVSYSIATWSWKHVTFLPDLPWTTNRPTPPQESSPTQPVTPSSSHCQE